MPIAALSKAVIAAQGSAIPLGVLIFCGNSRYNQASVRRLILHLLVFNDLSNMMFRPDILFKYCSCFIVVKRNDPFKRHRQQRGDNDDSLALFGLEITSRVGLAWSIL